MQSLKNNHIQLRAVEPEDLDILYLWENDPSIWQVSNTLVPFSRYVLKQYLENAHQDIYEAKQLRLIIELTETEETVSIGMIDLFDFDPYHQRAGIGILIAQNEHRFKGYGKQALSLLIEYCFDHLGLHQLYCNINATNEASIALFKNLGFEITGIKTQWIKQQSDFVDELMLQLINPNHT